MKIGIFDSGIGGLTILKELLKEKPNNHYIYYGDNVNVPYGEKSKEELLKIGDKIIKYFISIGVDLIIIACGTMSSVIDKSKYNIKIIDIIEPTIKGLEKLDVDSILLLGTSRTIEEAIFKKKIEKLNIKVYDKACPKLPLLIEGILDLNIYDVLDEYLNEFKNININYIVLGCTHFPLVEEEISKCLNKKIVNIGKLISKDIKEDNISNVEIYFGYVDDNLKSKVKDIINLDVNKLTNL